MIEQNQRYLVPSFEVDVVEDLEFGQSKNEMGEMERLHLDLYLPLDDPMPRRPAIIWFHGGGFRPGNDKRQIYVPWFAKAFAARGYVGIAPDYRVRVEPNADPAGTVRDAMADARKALDWVRVQSLTYHLDPSRIALAGGSAGGILVFNLCHDPEKPVNKTRDGLFAMLSMWGPAGGPKRLFDEVNPDCPPTFLVHGTKDELVPYAWSQTLAEELDRAGVEHYLLTLPEAPHTPLKYMDQIIETMAEFLYKQVGDK